MSLKMTGGRDILKQATLPINTDFPCNSIPRNILAFRAITTILALAQQEQRKPFEAINEVSEKSRRRQELDISNAFANVASAHHGVVAVVTKLIGAHEIGLIVCPRYFSDKNKPYIATQNSSTFSKNFRRDDLPAAIPFRVPAIVDVAIAAASLKLYDDEGLNDYVQKHCSRNDTSLETHLSILNRLFTIKDPSAGASDDGAPQKIDFQKLNNHLERYVIATCHLKMLHRLKHQDMSLPYIESLKEVRSRLGDIPFNKSLQREKMSTAGYRNDTHFLLTFVLPKKLPPSCKVDKLYEQAKLAEEGKPVEIYTEATRMEFHDLLLFFLRHFRRSLEFLKQDRDQAISTDGGSGSKFNGHVTNVGINGYALQLMAHGTGLQTHLQSIAPFLKDRRLHSMPAPVPKAQEEEERNKEYGEGTKEHGKGEERDEELEAVQPFATTEEYMVTPLWKSYIDWLKLMVVHLEAADTLAHYADSFEAQTVSIKILEPPAVDNSLLTLEELFIDSKLFSTQKTSKDIFDFLNDGITAVSSCPQNSILDLIKDVQTCWRDKHFDKAIKCIKTLKDQKLPGLDKHLDKIIEDWTRNAAHFGQPGYPDFTEIFQLLLDRAEFFVNLEKRMKPGGFIGTLHSEACLASLLKEYFAANIKIDSEFEPLLNDMEGLGRVIGQSQRCCATCRHLLSLLTKGRDAPFLVTGSHTTVSACTLPTWLPGHIVDSMNQFFGNQLEQELLKVMRRPDSLWYKLYPDSPPVSPCPSFISDSEFFDAFF